MKNMKAAETLLERKGFYISNQFDGFTTLPDECELSDVNGNVVIDHLSEAQILQLSEILQGGLKHEKDGNAFYMGNNKER